MSIERILNKAQKRGVLSLVREREETVRAANEQVAEINAALAEQSEMLRASFGLPEGRYEFKGDPNEIKLVRVEEPAKTEEPPTPAEAPLAEPATIDDGQEPA